MDRSPVLHSGDTEQSRGHGQDGNNFSLGLMLQQRSVSGASLHRTGSLTVLKKRKTWAHPNSVCWVRSKPFSAVLQNNNRTPAEWKHFAAANPRRRFITRIGGMNIKQGERSQVSGCRAEPNCYCTSQCCHSVLSVTVLYPYIGSTRTSLKSWVTRRIMLWAKHKDGVLKSQSETVYKDGWHENSPEVKQYQFNQLLVAGCTKGNKFPLPMLFHHRLHKQENMSCTVYCTFIQTHFKASSRASFSVSPPMFSYVPQISSVKQ